MSANKIITNFLIIFHLSVAATALVYFGNAGEEALRTASTPGSFMKALFEALYNITPEKLKNECKIE